MNSCVLKCTSSRNVKIGIPSPGDGRERHREEGSLLPPRPPWLPDLLPDEPGHHRPSLRAHQGAQARRQQGQARGGRQQIQSPGEINIKIICKTK